MGNPVHAPTGGAACAEAAEPVLSTSNPRSRHESFGLKAQRKLHGRKVRGRISGTLLEMAPVMAVMAQVDAGTPSRHWPCRKHLPDALHPIAG